jgi:hypothetical protein
VPPGIRRGEYPEAAPLPAGFRLRSDSGRELSLPPVLLVLFGGGAFFVARGLSAFLVSDAIFLAPPDGATFLAPVDVAFLAPPDLATAFLWTVFWAAFSATFSTTGAVIFLATSARVGQILHQVLEHVCRILGRLSVDLNAARMKCHKEAHERKPQKHKRECESGSLWHPRSRLLQEFQDVRLGCKHEKHVSHDETDPESLILEHCHLLFTRDATECRK